MIIAVMEIVRSRIIIGNSTSDSKRLGPKVLFWYSSFKRVSYHADEMPRESPGVETLRAPWNLWPWAGGRRVDEDG